VAVGSTVADLVQACCERLELDPDGIGAFSARTGESLAPTAAVDDAGLLEGDLIVLAPELSTIRDGNGAAAPCELAVVGGPCAGRRFALTAGEHVAGRDPDCDLVLPDPSLSRRHLRLRVGATE